jgi:S-adenosylmethionine synthetase
MSMRDFVHTSTSVTEGHPDKLCDRISDAVVDAYLTQDPKAFINAECAIASGIVFLATHAESEARVDLTAVVQAAVGDAGYSDSDFDPETVTVLSTTSRMPQLRLVGDATQLRGANASATMFGYACRQTEELIPLPIALSHRLVRSLQDLRRSERGPLFHPDGQAQVAIRYVDRKPVAVEGLTLISAVVGKGAPEEVDALLRAYVLDPVLAESGLKLSPEAVVMINPFGSALPGGPTRHAGLTGRKNDIDTYGGYSRHGGAALSGKDPSRIDRLGAYAARYAAKNVVASGIASECEVQISCAMGREEPISVEVDTFGSGKASDKEISSSLKKAIDFGASALAERFQLATLPQLRQGRFFADLAVLGHVGRSELDLPWEATDCSAEIEKAA